MPGNGKKPCGSLPHSRNAAFQFIPEMIRPPPAAPSQPPEPHKNHGLRARKQPAFAAPAGQKNLLHRRKFPALFNSQFLCGRPRTRRSRRETTLLPPHPARRKTVVCTNQGFLSKNSVPRPPAGRRAFGRSLFIVTVFFPSVKCRRRVSCTGSAHPSCVKAFLLI